MKRYFALAASFLFHPLFMPLVGCVYLLFSGSYISLLPHEIKRILLLVIGANTLGLPLLMMPLFLQFGVIKSFSMDSNRERIVPLAFILIPYIFTYYFLNRLPIPPVIGRFMLGVIMAIIATLIISFWWKISIHLIGIGGLAGFLTGFSIKYYTDVIVILFLTILVAGVLAASRMYLRAHRPLQVYVGFILGFTILLIVVLL
jgi:membrane-associated phospholipid phosphatase